MHEKSCIKTDFWKQVVSSHGNSTVATHGWGSVTRFYRAYQHVCLLIACEFPVGATRFFMVVLTPISNLPTTDPWSQIVWLTFRLAVAKQFWLWLLWRHFYQCCKNYFRTNPQFRRNVVTFRPFYSYHRCYRQVLFASLNN